MTYDFWTDDGRMVLAYDREKARPVIESLFSDPTPEATAANPSHSETLEAEDARIAIYNGTNSEGLAAAVASFLEMQGIQTVVVGNADHFDYPRTLISVYNKRPATVDWLTSWLMDIGIPEPILQAPPSRPEWDQSGADISITVGADFPAGKFN
jgi:hypothetical protein